MTLLGAMFRLPSVRTGTLSRLVGGAISCGCSPGIPEVAEELRMSVGGATTGSCKVGEFLRWAD